MTKLEQGQVFRTLTKVGTLSSGEDWLVYEVVELKKKQYYKLSLAYSPAYRCMAIVTFEEIHNALESGWVQLLDKKKIKKTKESKK